MFIFLLLINSLIYNLNAQCNAVISSYSTTALQTAEYYQNVNAGSVPSVKHIILGGSYVTGTANTRGLFGVTPIQTQFTPTVATNVQLFITNGANDVAGGSGCRSIYLEGTDGLGAFFSGTFNTPTGALTAALWTETSAYSWTSVSVARCVTSGTVNGANVATISIYLGSGTTNMVAQIGSTTLAGGTYLTGSSPVMVYRVPSGKSGAIIKHIRFGLNGIAGNTATNLNVAIKMRGPLATDAAIVIDNYYTFVGTYNLVENESVFNYVIPTGYYIWVEVSTLLTGTIYGKLNLIEY